MSKTILTSLRWLTASRLLSQLITWTLTIVIIRLLSPTDYGLMALASLFIGFFSLVESLGLSAALVNVDSVDDADISNILGFLLLFSVAMYVAIFFSARHIGHYFEEPELRDILLVLGVRLPMSSMSSVPASLLQRSMNFRAKSIVEFTSAVLSGVVTLVLALLGYGVWALVYGALSLTVVNLIGLSLAVGRIYRPTFRLRALSSFVRFGGFVSLDRILWYLSSQADVFLIGKFLGKQALGVYAVAMQLATLPMQKVAQILSDVGFAAFSRIQADRPDVGQKFLLSVRMVSFLSFPVFFGIGAISTEFVPLFLGDDWLGVVSPMMLLPLTVPLRMLDTINATVLFGIGKPERAAGNKFIALLILAPAFLAAIYWGDIVTVCLAWLVFYPIYFAIALRRTLPLLQLRFSEYFRQLVRPLAFALIMFGSLVAVEQLLPDLISNPVGSLVAYIVVGALIYASLQLLFDKSTLNRFVEIVRR